MGIFKVQGNGDTRTWNIQGTFDLQRLLEKGKDG